MKNFLRFYIVFILLMMIILISPSGLTQNLLVQGAGYVPVNGLYLLDGTYNGRNKYTQDELSLGTRNFIYWNGINKWIVAPVDNPTRVYYFASVSFGFSTQIPPASGWATMVSLYNPPPTLGSTALPVELVSFSAQVTGSSVTLHWRTETEVNNYGFDVQRSLSPLSQTGKPLDL